MSEQFSSQMRDLFDRTWHAHHAAFEEVDGHDPEWPAWYARYMGPELAALLGQPVAEATIAAHLTAADQAQRQEAPGGDWREFYARYFLERYVD